MLERFQTYKTGILGALRDVLADAARMLEPVSPMGAELMTRLEAYAASGKMIRGILVRLGYELCAPEAPDAAMIHVLERAGAAMECFQAGLLIHDDIMDRDCMRRGDLTIHARYRRDAAHAQASDPDHHGDSLGICAGDVAFFIGFQILTELPVAGAMREAAREAAALAARELCLVGIAQMQDVTNGFGGSAIAPSPADILQLYRYKTARYTFSLPLVTGAMLAGARPEAIAALDQSGEHLGVLFQLKDDELGVFSDVAESGKSAGSDIREDKKTLLRHALYAAADAELRAALDRIFSGPLSEEDLRFVRAAMARTGAHEQVRRTMERFAREASARLENLVSPDSEHVHLARATYENLIRYSLDRTS